MAGKPHIPFYPGDWLRDGIAGCSLAAQGLWLRMMFVAHDSPRYGYLEVNGSPMPSDVIARRCGCDDLAQYGALLSELDIAGVPSRTDQGIIYSRRMVRDASVSSERAKAGKKGGKQTAKQNRSKRAAKGQQNADIDTDNDSENDTYSKELTAVLDTPEFRATFGHWLAYKGRRYKPAGLRSLISRSNNLAEKHGVAAVVDAMERAMANGWKGWDQESSFSKPAGPANDPRGNLAVRNSFLEKFGDG